jgi:hypothetical protein
VSCSRQRAGGGTRPPEFVEEIQHERDVKTARHGFIRLAEQRDTLAVGREIDAEVDPRIEWDRVDPAPNADTIS